MLPVGFVDGRPGEHVGRDGRDDGDIVADDLEQVSRGNSGVGLLSAGSFCRVFHGWTGRGIYSRAPDSSRASVRGLFVLRARGGRAIGRSTGHTGVRRGIKAQRLASAKGAAQRVETPGV